MKVAISTLKVEGIEKLIVALPVAPPETAEELRRMADEFICLELLMISWLSGRIIRILLR